MSGNGTMMQYFEWYLPSGMLWKQLKKEAPELAEELLSAYTEAQAQKAWDWAWKMVEQLGEERILKNSSTRYLPPENV